jgi:hypothetical protein
VAHDFLDRTRCEFGVFTQQRPLGGVVAEDIEGGGQLVASGVGAGAQQRDCER